MATYNDRSEGTDLLNSTYVLEESEMNVAEIPAKNDGISGAAALSENSEDLKEVLRLRGLVFRARLEKKDDELRKKNEELEKLKLELDKALTDEAEMKKRIVKHDRTISQLIADKEHQRNDFKLKISEAKTDKDKVSMDFKNAHSAFGQLVGLNSRMNAAADAMRKNEETLQKAIVVYQEQVTLEKNKCKVLNTCLEEKLQNIEQRRVNTRRKCEAEIAKLRADLRVAELSVLSTERALQQRVQENEQLKKFRDDLISQGESIKKKSLPD